MAEALPLTLPPTGHDFVMLNPFGSPRHRAAIQQAITALRGALHP